MNKDELNTLYIEYKKTKDKKKLNEIVLFFKSYLTSRYSAETEHFETTLNKSISKFKKARINHKKADFNIIIEINKIFQDTNKLVILDCLFADYLENRNQLASAKFEKNTKMLKRNL